MSASKRCSSPSSYWAAPLSRSDVMSSFGVPVIICIPPCCSGRLGDKVYADHGQLKRYPRVSRRVPSEMLVSYGLYKLVLFARSDIKGKNDPATYLLSRNAIEGSTVAARSPGTNAATAHVTRTMAAIPANMRRSQASSPAGSKSPIR